MVDQDDTRHLYVSGVSTRHSRLLLKHYPRVIFEVYPNGVDRCRQGSAPCHLSSAATNIDIHQLIDLKGEMRLRSGPIGLLLAATNVHDCLAANNSRSSASFLPRKASTERWELIPRGGAVSLDPKTVATAGLSCLAAHCAFDILAPSTMVEFYGLDKYQRINSFYFPRIGGWGLAVVGSLLLQLYSTVPFLKAIGYSFLPITIITVCQLLTGQYEQVSYDVLPERQSWVPLSYICVCLFVCRLVSIQTVVLQLSSFTIFTS